MGLSMGLDYKGAVAKIVQAPRVGHAPCIKDLGEMTENFRRKERTRDFSVSPFDPDGLIQQTFILVMVIPVAFTFFLDMDVASAGDRSE